MQTSASDGSASSAACSLAAHGAVEGIGQFASTGVPQFSESLIWEETHDGMIATGANKFGPFGSSHSDQSLPSLNVPG